MDLNLLFNPELSSGSRDSLFRLCDLQYWEYDVPSGQIILGSQVQPGKDHSGFQYRLSHEEATAMVHEGDREIIRYSLEQILTGQKSIYDVEFRAAGNDAPVKWFRNRGIVLRTSQEGLPLTLCGLIQDITDQKQLQDRLTDSLKQAGESDKLKTAFLTNISHEIRTPLNAIIGFSELMSDVNLSRDEVAMYAAIIKGRSTHLLQIVSDILDISRIESNLVEIKETAFALNPLLDDLYIGFAQKLLDDKKTHIRLQTDKALQDASFLIISDELRLKQILGNLLDNAIKFTQQGSITFGYRLSGEELIFFVKDTGVGIAPDNHEVIFDRFRQVDNTMIRQYGGNGLGLSISKSLIELMGGRIWLESKPDEGSEFFFTLPCSKVAITDSPETSRFTGMSVLNWHQKRILLVEDDPLSAGLLSDVFGRTGAELITAVNGREAFRLFRTEAFDLVIMDILLPDISGLELTRMIKELKPGLPVIAQTAHTLPGDHLQCLQAGCDEYITKPVNISELISLVNRFFRR